MILHTKSRNKIPEPPRNRRSNGRKVSIAITGRAISSDVSVRSSVAVTVRAIAMAIDVPYQRKKRRRRHGI